MHLIDNYEFKVENIIKNYREAILKNPHIIGFGRGVKIIGNERTNIPCLTLFVDKKVPVDTLSEDYIIPKYFNRVLTDVKALGETPPKTPSLKYRAIEKNLISGMSIGNENNNYGGTITCGFLGKYEKNKSKQMFILSCASALAQINWEIGSVGGLGDTICSPMKTSNEIGNIVDISALDVGVKKNPSDSDIDAVLILLKKNIKVIPGLNEGGRIYGITDTAPGVKVYYDGAGSGRLYGHVLTINTVFRNEMKNNKGDSLIVNYSPITTIEAAYNESDRGAMGVVQTLSKKNYGFGMLVAGKGNTVVFTDMKRNIDYFKSNFDLELIY